MATKHSGDGVVIFEHGADWCSACAPTSMQVADVEAAVNEQIKLPCGGRFRSYEMSKTRPGPSIPECNDDVHGRRHWYLVKQPATSAGNFSQAAKGVLDHAGWQIVDLPTVAPAGF